jgi:hypothetical protein
MNNVIGLLGLALFIVCVIGLAAGITWLVIRVTPKKHEEPKPETPA